MNDSFKKIAATILSLFWLVWLVPGAPAVAQDAVLIFSAMGDVPYSSSGETTLQQQIADHNKYSPSEFMVHLGDIKPGGGGCPESVYQTVAGYLLNLKVPTFIVPGDNEWTGCSDWDQAWSYWEEYFMGFEQNFCGAPSVERQPVRPENFAWIKKGVLLIGINMPGGNKKNPELWDQRLQDNADWVVQQFQEHADDVRAAVIFAHCMKRTQDVLFFDQFRPAAAAFAKPILYIHGNDHSWTMDRPLPEQNVLRVCVDEGGKALPVEVTVTLNAQNMFTFDRVPWNSNSQPINYDPCAVPGPDITVNPTTYNYGQVQVSSNATKTFVVSNTGNENLEVTQVTIAGTDAGEFHIDSGGGAFTLTPSANRNVVVRFAPSTEGGKNAILRLVSNDPDEDPFEVSLSGSGVVFQPPVISSFTPSSGAPGTQVTIVGSNFNGATQVAFGGTASSNFNIDSNTQILADVPSGAATGKITVSTPGGTATSADDFTVTPPPPITTFSPTDDAYVKSTEASANFGLVSTLRLRQSSTILNSYLKFEISGLSASVHSAKLRLYVTSASNSGGSVYLVLNNYAGSSTAWTESGLTYSNAPAMSGSPLSTVGSVSSGQWVEFDVTAAIAGNGTYSFGLKNSSSTAVQYSSKEGANDPELVIETGSGPPPPPPTPALSINNVSVNEGDVGTVNAVFTVTLSATSTQEVSVDYATADGSATAGGDYLADAGSITFSPGTTSQTISIVVNSDVLDESDENFLVNLSNPVHATIDDGQGSATIVDDDGSSGGGSPNTFNPVHDAYVKSTEASANFGSVSTLRLRQSSTVLNSYLKFEISGLSASVHSAKLRLYVTSASNSGGSVYLVSNNYAGSSTAWTESGLTYSNAPAMSGSPLSTVGSVSSGQWVEFDVTAAIAGNGTYSFGLKNSSSTAAQYSSKEGANDPELVIETGSGPPPPPPTPALSINNVSVNEGDVGTVNAVFTVTLSATSTQEVSVDYATADGSATAGDDYLADAGSITFSPGTTSQTISIVVNSDVLDESDENFLVNLSNPVHATIDDGQGSATIVDDDGSSGGGSPNTFNPVHDAYVKSTEASANFGSASTLRLRQSSTILNSYLKFEVSGLDASVHSAKLRLYVTSASNSGGSVYPVSNNYAGSSTAWTESGLTYSNAPAMSGSPLSTVGSVSSGQWVEFDVTAAIAGNGTYSFGVKNSSSTAAQYSSKEGANDPELVIETGSGPPPPPPTPALSINNVSVNEGNVGTVNAVFTVTLSATSSQEVSVDYATADGSATAGDDYLADTGSIIFSPGTTAQTITIVVNSDVLDESDENFLVNLSNPAHATIDDGQGSGTIADDDGSSGGGSPNTFNPTDDAYARMSSPTSTSPNSSSLRVRKTSSETILSFLKFEVSGIAGVVQSAKLRLFVTDASNDGGSVYAVSNNYRGTTTPWLQSGLNWNNAPLIEETALSSAGAVSAGAWVELEVSSAITGNGIYSFALQNNSSDVVYYTSREGTNKPELVIQTGSSKIASHAAMDEVAATVTAPERFNLGQNYPNPFNPSTTIPFELPEAGRVMLRVYSLTGQLVREVASNQYSAGRHQVTWDTRNENGKQVATGVYFYQLVVQNEVGRPTFMQTRRMVFAK